MIPQDNATVTRRSVLAVFGAAAIASPVAIIGTQAGAASQPDPHLEWELQRDQAERAMNEANERAAIADAKPAYLDVPSCGAWFERRNDAGEITGWVFRPAAELFDSMRREREFYSGRWYKEKGHYARLMEKHGRTIAKIKENGRVRRHAIAHNERLRIESGAPALYREGERQCAIVLELEDKIAETPANTMAGLAVQVRLLIGTAGEYDIDPDSAQCRNILASIARLGGAA